MPPLINTDVRGNVAVITMNHGPINSLGQGLRQALMHSLQHLSEDDAVDAIVIASAQKLFCGGADIEEFSSGQALSEPILPAVLDAIEASSKLVVAAVNGAALGGGCELALACDYRIGQPKSSMGLPEVHLGIIPGAGGTQRLPRIAGVPFALDAIVSGRNQSADQLQTAGVIDRITNESDLTGAATAYARELLAAGAAKRRCSDMRVDTSALPDNFFADYRANLATRTRGFYAPVRAVDAVEAATQLSFAEGMQKELAIILDCIDTPQARAQQHVFFAERQVSKIPGVDPKAIQVRDIKKVAIIGSGTMGGGIAMNFLNAGIPTIILDQNGDALSRGIGTIRKNYEISANKGRLTPEQVETRLALLEATTEYADLDAVDLVIEAVFEQMEVKKTVFTMLDKVCKPGAILATNTSTLDVNEIAAATHRPEDVLGLHFFSPANVMKLLEIVCGSKTSTDVLYTAVRLAQTIRKVPVVSGVCWGFIGNRATDPYLRETMSLILEGATPAQIDRVHTEFGMPMGLPSMADMAGIDVGIFAREGREAYTTDIDPAYWAVPKKLCEMGRLGQKTGRGLYLYDGRNQQEDPEVMKIAAACARGYGIQQREISDQEILERTIYPMINEAAHILEDGMAYRSGDIDIILVYGFGFPAYRGGPLQYADEIGPAKVLEGMNKYRQQVRRGDIWFKPAPLLEHLAKSGKTFKSFVPKQVMEKNLL